MGKLSVVGRIFYGIAITGMGVLSIYYSDFPYMLIPPKHSWITGLAMVAIIFGAMLILAGVCIVFEMKIRPISLLLGTILLMIFCFYFIPYQLVVSANYMHFGDWENAAKELALSSGGFIIAGCYAGENDSAPTRFWRKLIPFGTVLFSITIISFGINHFLFAKAAADYVPSWVPYHLFWIYFTGTALICSGLAIILKFQPVLVATLLGTMILTWFIILHLPRVIASPIVYIGSEVTSALIAFAYSGIAFVIAGAAKKQH